ncbi:MAG TPA: hypothetical protein DDZ43_02045, partial [Hyphomonadaceae bacterium]|nr:hypothetical protein [Hyphomonadaceae bacterium]
MAGMFGPMFAAARMEERRAAAGGGNNRNRRGGPMMTLFSIFPLLTIPVVIYNIMAFAFTGSGPIDAGAAAPILANLEAPMLSLS